eukprot:2330507-Pleurochrysis_carterae.AAC.1
MAAIDPMITIAIFTKNTFGSMTSVPEIPAMPSPKPFENPSSPMAIVSPATRYVTHRTVTPPRSLRLAADTRTASSEA